MNISLKEKVAIVTGASSGIGLGISKRLAEVGATVALFDIKEPKREDKRQIQEFEGNTKFFHCDVTDKAECKRSVEAVENEFDRIDIVVNNAGIIKRKNVVELKEEEWDAVLAVNLKGVYLISKYAIPLMANHGGGSIINIASGWGIRGGPKAAAYCASKGGVVNLTRAMAIDHGEDGIRVNSVSPGDTDTQLLRREAKLLGKDEGDFLDSSTDRPIPRLGTPLDIANAVLFLASDLSEWITGENLVVDGGGTAG